MGLTRIIGQDVRDGTLTDQDVATANKDGLAATPSLRTLGTGSQQAAAGNDPRITGALSAANIVENEEPSGTIDGSNAVFTLAFTPAADSTVKLYKNGLRMKQGGPNDYTISGATLTFNAGQIPQTGDSLVADYRR